MSTTPTARLTRVKAIAEARGQIDERMYSKPGVVGSMIGAKIRGGVIQPTVGLTFFVREKASKTDLSPTERVPARVRIGNLSIATDVLEWPQMREQSWAGPTIIDDGRSQGSMTCFGHTEAGAFGISCAHCLVGKDGRPATPTNVDFYSNSNPGWNPAGEHISCIFIRQRPVR